MIGEICAEIKNYFTYEHDRHIGDWVISNGTVSPALDFPTTYFRIVGSRLNDGVHKVLPTNVIEPALVDEEFHGAIWVMSPPVDFLNLAGEIAEWQNKNGNVNSNNMSPFQSESFGGYSYSKGTVKSNSAGASSVPTWQSQYASRLKRYRRINEL